MRQQENLSVLVSVQIVLRNRQTLVNLIIQASDIVPLELEGAKLPLSKHFLTPRGRYLWLKAQ